MNRSVWLLIEPEIDAGAVCGEAFAIGQASDIGGEVGEGLSVDLDDAGRAQEVVGGKAVGPAGGAAGGQDVGGAGRVVAEGDGCPVAQEGSAGGGEAVGQ